METFENTSTISILPADSCGCPAKHRNTCRIHRQIMQQLNIYTHCYSDIIRNAKLFAKFRQNRGICFRSHGLTNISFQFLEGKFGCTTKYFDICPHAGKAATLFGKRKLKCARDSSVQPTPLFLPKASATKLFAFVNLATAHAGGNELGSQGPEPKPG